MGVLWIENSAVMKLLQLFSQFRLVFLSKDLKSLFDNLLGKDGLIFDDVGW